MASVRFQDYGVPIEVHLQPVLFDPGKPPPKDDPLSYRGLEKRLHMVRKVKLQLEEEKERDKENIKHLLERLDVSNRALYSKGECYKQLYLTEEKLKLSRLRIKEIWMRCEQVEADNDRIQNTVDKFRDEYKCKGPCGKVKSYKCFARDPGSITGREVRCNVCQREKTARWRAAKKLIQQ